MIFVLVPQLALVGIVGVILLAVGVRKRAGFRISFGMILVGFSVAGISLDLLRIGHSSDVRNIPAPDPSVSEMIVTGVFVGVGCALMAIGLARILSQGRKHKKDTSS